MAADCRLRHGRLRDLYTLSRYRILADVAGLRCRLADDVVQDPLACDVSLSPFGVRYGRARHRGPAPHAAVDRFADRRPDCGRIWHRALQYRLSVIRI